MIEELFTKLMLPYSSEYVISYEEERQTQDLTEPHSNNLFNDSAGFEVKYLKNIKLFKSSHL